MQREEATKKIEAGIQALYDELAAGRSDRLVEYLKVMGRFHRYSFGNIMLILLQNPEATHVAGYSRWQQLGRQVKKGESGIGILAPIRYRVKNEDDEQAVAIKGFKLVHVFDISQTEGDDLPQFTAIAGDPGEHLARIEQVIGNHDIALVDGMLESGTLGTSAGGTITLRPDLSAAERCSVAIHEFSHELLHHGDRRHETTKIIRETEAEATAFVVLNALGIDSKARSSDYIQLHRGSTDTLAESLEHIQKTALYILEQMAAIELGDKLQTTPACNHTLYHDDPDTTWTAVATEDGTRFECHLCRKFYGFHPNTTTEPPTKLVAQSIAAEQSDSDLTAGKTSSKCAVTRKPLPRCRPRTSREHLWTGGRTSAPVRNVWQIKKQGALE